MFRMRNLWKFNLCRRAYAFRTTLPAALFLSPVHCAGSDKTFTLATTLMVNFVIKCEKRTMAMKFGMIKNLNLSRIKETF